MPVTRKDIKWRKPRAGTHQYTFEGLAGSQFELGILPNRKMIRILFLQRLKHQIHRILVLFVILADLHGIDKFDQSSEVLLLFWSFVMNIADQGTVEQRLCLVPEGITAFSFTLGIGHQRRDQLQDILFAVYIGKRIIMHRLPEIDRIEDLDPVFCPYKGMPDLN